jgi:hypothetical protein
MHGRVSDDLALRLKGPLSVQPVLSSRLRCTLLSAIDRAMAGVYEAADPYHAVLTKRGDPAARRYAGFVWRQLP